MVHRDVVLGDCQHVLVCTGMQNSVTHLGNIHIQEPHQLQFQLLLGQFAAR
jgi:hypothetical protein